MPGWVLLRVEGNGPGLTTDPATSPGWGLRGIRDRVALLGGTLAMGYSPVAGTYVRLRPPWSNRQPEYGEKLKQLREQGTDGQWRGPDFQSASR